MQLNQAIIKQVAREMGIAEAFVEKDWFITQTIKILIENPYQDFQLVFAGGTALSKAHKLIQRFSEDIDFRITAPSLSQTTTSIKRKKLSGFKKHVLELLENHYPKVSLIAKDNNKHIIFEIDYPTIYEITDILRPHIKLEFILADLILSGVMQPVSSFINELSNADAEIQQVLCLNPVENSADKLSAIVWRIPSRIRGNNDKQPDIVRHLHDLTKLSEQALNSPDFIQLAVDTIDRDKDRAEMLAGLSISEKLSKVLNILDTDPEYPKEYERFVNSMSYA